MTGKVKEARVKAAHEAMIGPLGALDRGVDKPEIDQWKWQS